jgi:hypothetical protein
MLFKDKNIHDTMEKFKSQYQIFLHNEFINYYLMDSNISTNDWLDIEDFIDSNKYYEGEGYDLNKFYDYILTFSSLLGKVKKEILPRMNEEAPYRTSKMSKDKKILFEMTIDNLPENIKIFYDLIIELFIKVKKVDQKLNSEENMLYFRLPYMREIEKLLNA